MTTKTAYRSAAGDILPHTLSSEGAGSAFGMVLPTFQNRKIRESQRADVMKNTW